jgi:hypothetical protein
MIMNPQALLGMAGAVNRFVEVLKPIIRQWVKDSAAYKAVVQVLSILFGIGIASLSPDLNLFSSIPNLTPILATILTGTTVGLGADAINAVIGLLYWNKPVTSVPEVNDATSQPPNVVEVTKPSVIVSTTYDEKKLS